MIKKQSHVLLLVQPTRIRLKGLKKTMKASVTIAGDGVKIYTQNFSNINGNHYLVTFSQ